MAWRRQFEIIPSHQIDAEKWDRCIVNSEANSIYASYMYLQHLADNWSGVVIDDYNAVMPIVWRKKWGIRYAYNAPFIQQLGSFGKFNTDDLRKAVDTTFKYIKYGDLYFNHTNVVQQYFPAARAATNLIIPLQAGYERISEGYNNHLRNQLRKASVQLLQYSISDNIELVVQTYQQLYAQRFPSIKGEHYQRLIALAKQLFNRQQCFVRQVVDKAGSVLAIALFFTNENRIYNILPSTTGTGRKFSAMHFLVDQVLKEYSGKQLIFDFEGSDVPGIKAFYQSFGAVNELYYHLHYNRLPLPFRWLKH